MLKLRDDVVLEKVSGIYILVALRSAWSECPFALQIAPYAAYLWKAIREGKSKEELINGICAERGMDYERAERAYKLFIKDAEKYHYLLPEDTV